VVLARGTGKFLCIADNEHYSNMDPDSIDLAWHYNFAGGSGLTGSLTFARMTPSCEHTAISVPQWVNIYIQRSMKTPSEAGQQRVDLPFRGQFRVLILHEGNPSKKYNSVSNLT
jgi:hypothetical protein